MSEECKLAVTIADWALLGFGVAVIWLMLLIERHVRRGFRVTVVFHQPGGVSFGFEPKSNEEER